MFNLFLLFNFNLYLLFVMGYTHRKHNISETKTLSIKQTQFPTFSIDPNTPRKTICKGPPYGQFSMNICDVDSEGNIIL